MVATVLRLAAEDLPMLPLFSRKLTWATAKKVSASQWPNDVLELRWVRLN
jgi:peptide/nickel transport system substrate-binding protein